MFTTPRTWVVSDKVTTWMLNTHLRDNLLFLYDPPGCSLGRTGLKQTVSSDQWTTLDWGTKFGEVTWASPGMVAEPTPQSFQEITLTPAGKWRVILNTHWSLDNNNERRGAKLRFNDSSEITMLFQVEPTQGSEDTIVSAMTTVNVADPTTTMRVETYQDAGEELLTEGSRLTARWLAG